MNASPIPPCRIATERLVLRPTNVSDAERAFEIQSDWEVTRMLRMVSFPPDGAEISHWFADHEREWMAGEAYRFAVELQDRLIGIVDVDGISGREGELGYWFERASWGRGYALEAAQAVVQFAFSRIGLSKLRSGHAADNPASGKVLRKLGFRPLDSVRAVSRSRGQEIMQQRYSLLTPNHCQTSRESGVG
ncbi:ribosomal-protein-alanine N-acetyltransferase [Mesorhizobium soli]|uniref:GNAT family N-acetyltransferase n=1 Tax=Pseudaminobacter soli (ex Li et al. 2025) TaxID=1295366 RepID=UPI002473EC02|nr:GNAT family N-acetyltransferase [Mesorhizobium soli]MDH6233869.1 ribosomal-protein-alanine N-acetyltransferase [Mesorhizobium soli]